MIDKKNILNFFFIFVIFLIDRISKILIITSAGISGEFYFNVSSFLSLNLIWNEGIAFGLFSFEQDAYYNILTLIIIIITIVVIWLMYTSKGLEKIGYLMILGGSSGNIFDRMYYSSVPDFIDINFKNFHWFIFNVADIFISLGVILLIYSEIFLKDKNKI
jgi:signal peptidase II